VSGRAIKEDTISGTAAPDLLEDEFDPEAEVDLDIDAEIDAEDDGDIDAEVDVEVELEVEYIEFELGDNVVYPHHGAGKVCAKEIKEIFGERREYLTIKILHNDMTVNVPAENAERVGLRKVIDEEAVKKVVKYLTSGGTEMPKNWNRRFKHNRDKMKTGDVFELAEVVRNLSLRDGEKGLSTGEKQMYVKAKKILASELMYAKNLSEDDAFVWLEGVLTGATSDESTRPTAAKRVPAAKATPKAPAAA
jgi:CarD family transcriptional regulator